MPYYAVAKGIKPGIYETWPACQENVKGFGGAKYKKFTAQKDAIEFVKKFGNGDIKLDNLNKENQPQTSSRAAPKRKAEETKSWNSKKTKDNNEEKNKSAYPDAPSDKDADYERYNSLKQTEDGYLLKKDGETYVVYTDGACPGNQNKKGLRFSGSGVWWGPAKADSVPNPRFENEYSTNNFGEALAILYAVRHAKEMKFSKIEVRTDSKFCISALDVWIIKWKRFAVDGKWTKFDKSPIIHQEIFEEIDTIRRHNVDVIFRHVKGHNGELGNEQADKLAVKAAEEHRRLYNIYKEEFAKDM